MSQLWKQTNAGSKKKGVIEPWSNWGKSQTIYSKDIN